MARLPRFCLPGQPQHLIQRGNNRDIIFVDDGDYRFYLEKLHDACTRYGCTVHAYVLMTNHTHLLLTPATDKAIGYVMQSATHRPPPIEHYYHIKYKVDKSPQRSSE